MPFNHKEIRQSRSSSWLSILALAALLAPGHISIAEAAGAKAPKRADGPGFIVIDSSSPVKKVGRALTLLDPPRAASVRLGFENSAGDKVHAVLTVLRRGFVTGESVVGAQRVESALLFENAGCPTSDQAYAMNPLRTQTSAGIIPEESFPGLAEPVAVLFAVGTARDLFLPTSNVPQTVTIRSELVADEFFQRIQCKPLPPDPLEVYPMEFVADLHSMFTPPFDIKLARKKKQTGGQDNDDDDDDGGDNDDD